MRSWITVVLAGLLAGANVYSAWAAVEPGAPVVTASFDIAKPVSARQRLEFKVDRAVDPAEGRIAVFIGTTDVSNLVQRIGDTLAYIPGVLPLPQGESWVSLYIVSPANTWKPIARFALRVQAASQQQTTSVQTQGSPPAAAPHRTWGFDKAVITPSVTIGMKSQPAESNFPASNASTVPNAAFRSTFVDGTLQGSMTSDLVRGRFEAVTQFNIVGSTFQPEALRFPFEGANAPEVDLASYAIQLRFDKVRLNVGSISFGSNRELMNNFASRGFSLFLPLSHGFDLSAAAMNGTSIVGWSNFFGLEQAKHHIATATLGFEALPKRPGGLRLEATVMDGEVLPLTSFNQGAITDAQRSRGFGFRLLASEKSQRWRIDAGFARSRFTNPPDPLLNQGVAVVPVGETTRNAFYLDGSYMLLRNRALGKTRKANLTATYHNERVDPLFRSIASFTQADRFQNQLDLVAQLGDVTATVSHLRLNDNLAEIPSIPKTLTRRTNFIVGVPLSTVFSDVTHPHTWLPRVSYTLDDIHQFGATFPTNGGFELNPSTIPNQVSTNQTLTADWKFKRLRVGYRFNRSFQDNRQVDRELADFRNVVNSVSVGIAASKTLDFTIDVGRESAFNREMMRTDRTFRIGGNLNWRINQRMTVLANISTTDVDALAGLVQGRSTLVNAQWSYQWLHEKSRFRKVRSQFFVRYADQYVFRRDPVVAVDSLMKLQTMNVGISFTFF